MERSIEDIEKSMKRSNDKQLKVELECCQRVCYLLLQHNSYGFNFLSCDVVTSDCFYISFFFFLFLEAVDHRFIRACEVTHLIDCSILGWSLFG